MAGPLQVRVLDREQTVFSQDFTGAVELGRQTDGAEQIYTAKQLATGRWRAVIARLDEDTLSRRHALIEPVGPGRVRLTNLSAKVPIRLGTADLPAGAAREVELPATLVIGRRTVRLQDKDRREPTLRSLPMSLAPPGQMTIGASIAASKFPTLVANTVERDDLLRWLQTAMGVIQAAAGSTDFIPKAAQALVDEVGFDTGRVLLLHEGEWRPVEVRTAPGVQLDPSW